MKDLVLHKFIYLPVSIVWVMLLIIIFNHKRITKTFKIVFILFFVLSLPLTSNILKYPLTQGAADYKKGESVSIVLVPTAGSYQAFDNNWYPSSETVMRVSKGYNISKTLNVPLILSGGAESISHPAESILALKIIDEKNNTFLDSKSKNTYETAKNLQDILFDIGANDENIILLVTSSVHNLRTALVLKSHGYKVLIYNKDNFSIDIFDVIPDSRSFGYFNKIIYEYLGIIKYIFKGYIGFDVLMT